MSTFLSRRQFEAACKAFIVAHSSQPSEDASIPPWHSTGWSWNNHPSVPGLGFMSRSLMLSPKAGEAFWDEDENMELSVEATPDEATAPESAEYLTCIQSVVYSPTFQVPAFYFTMHYNNGAPLSLVEIMASPLLRRHAIPPAEATSFALTEDGSTFPLLSQGDHPVLGTPAWYFHPCHTPDAVGELLSEVVKEGWKEEERLVRWMEVWFMIVRQIVDLQRGVVTALHS